ncbi:MAG: sigma-70 family RNA polymerase sigma factor [Gemmatimonadaceae bacterium]
MLETTHQLQALTPDAARERDRAFVAAALPLMPNVKRYALYLTRNESDADDIVQETYLRAHRYWSTFEDGSDCSKWLLTICRNVFTTRIHREERMLAVEDDELESLAAARTHNAARVAGVDDVYSRIDLGPAIRAAIDQLDIVFREVVVLSDIEGYSYEEIAETLGIPMGTVRSRLFRARRHLQAALMVYAIDAGYGHAKREHKLAAAEATGNG